MANTLTDLMPDFYVALDVVSRELTGMMPAVTIDANVARAAIGQSVRSFVAPAATAGDVTAGQLPPDDGDQTIGNVEVQITKSRRVPFKWNGEQSRGMNNGGPGTLNIQQNQVAQAIRTLVNEIEADLCSLHAKMSRAYGSAGTTPFGTAGDFTDASNVLKILKDNGAPLTDNHLVLNTTAGAKLLGLHSRFDIQGDQGFLRQGQLLDINGLAIRESGQVVTSVAGTASGATTDNAGYPVGSTTFTLASAGTGTLVAGDVITFAGDTNKYVITSGDADVSGGGSITIAKPGIRVAMSAATKLITVVAAAARNMAFTRSAIVLATRAPALPDGGDMAVDRSIITDPRTGLSFELSLYAGYRQMQYEIAIAWGKELVKAEHSALLLG